MMADNDSLKSRTKGQPKQDGGPSASPREEKEMTEEVDYGSEAGARRKRPDRP